MARGSTSSQGRAARSELSERLRAEAVELMERAGKIERQERADAIDAENNAKRKAAEAAVASGKIPTDADVLGAEKEASDYFRQNIAGRNASENTMNEWRDMSRKADKLRADKNAPALLKKLDEEAEYAKAQAKANKIINKLEPATDETTKGVKPQKLADKMTKLEAKASSLAEKYFGAKDKKTERAKANLAKTREAVKKQVDAIPTEVQFAIRTASGHGLASLEDAGFNSLRYEKDSGKITGGGGGDSDEYSYDSWSALGKEARSDGENVKQGSLTYKGVTYAWERSYGSTKIGYDPKQYATSESLKIRVGGKSVYKGETLDIEGG